jgi:hypothetical protein
MRAYVHFLVVLGLGAAMVMYIAGYYYFVYSPHRLIRAHYKLHLHLFFLVFGFSAGGLGVAATLLGRSLVCLAHGLTWQEMMLLRREKRSLHGRDGGEYGGEGSLRNACRLLGVQGQGWLGILKVVLVPPFSSLFNQVLHAYDNMDFPTDIV